MVIVRLMASLLGYFGQNVVSTSPRAGNVVRVTLALAAILSVPWPVAIIVIRGTLRLGGPAASAAPSCTLQEGC